MKKSNSLFASKSELSAFEAIDKHLPPGWRLFANTPFSRIVEIQREELTEKKWNFYLKASVDFVLADSLHRPALAIEFDGLGGGYSSGQNYVIGRRVQEDPHRELKTNFKLELCYAVGLPLIVIAFEEIKELVKDELLTIVASMVGKHIASREYRATIKEWDRQGKGEGKTFEEMLWDDSVLRTELAFRYDPFLSRSEQTWSDFQSLGATWTMSSLTQPDPFTAMREKRPLSSVGCRYEVKGGMLRNPVVVTVWVRNFAGHEFGPSLICSEVLPSHGINPLKVAENIAQFLAQKRAVEESRVVSCER